MKLLPITPDLRRQAKMIGHAHLRYYQDHCVISRETDTPFFRAVFFLGDGDPGETVQVCHIDIDASEGLHPSLDRIKADYGPGIASMLTLEIIDVFNKEGVELAGGLMPEVKMKSDPHAASGSVGAQQALNASPRKPADVMDSILPVEEIVRRLDDIPMPINEGTIIEKVFKTEFIESPKGGLTLCVLTMRNSFRIVGEANFNGVPGRHFDIDLARTLAYRDAIEKALGHETYLWCEQTSMIKGGRLAGVVPPVREGTFAKSEYPGIDLPSATPPPFFLTTFKDPTALRSYPGGVFIGDDFFTDYDRIIVWSPDRGHVSCFAVDRSNDPGTISELFRLEDQDVVVEALVKDASRPVDGPAVVG